MPEKPPWRIAIEQFERSIGAPLEEFMKSDQFADITANAAKGQTQIQRDVASNTNQLLHAMNLPTATDVAELRAEIAELRKEVRALAEDIKPRAKKPAAKKPAAKKPAAKKPSTARPPSTNGAQDQPTEAVKRTQTAKSPAKPK